MRIEALTLLDRTTRIRMCKNGARSRLFSRIAKRSKDLNKDIYVNVSMCLFRRKKLHMNNLLVVYYARLPELFTKEMLGNIILKTILKFLQQKFF